MRQQYTEEHIIGTCGHETQAAVDFPDNCLAMHILSSIITVLRNTRYCLRPQTLAGRYMVLHIAKELTTNLKAGKRRPHGLRAPLYCESPTGAASID